MGFTNDCAEKKGNPYPKIFEVLKSIGSSFMTRFWRSETTAVCAAIVAWHAMFRVVLRIVLQVSCVQDAVSTVWYDPGGLFSWLRQDACFGSLHMVVVSEFRKVIV